jgi:hypothetical protein
MPFPTRCYIIYSKNHALSQPPLQRCSLRRPTNSCELWTMNTTQSDDLPPAPSRDHAPPLVPKRCSFSTTSGDRPTVVSYEQEHNAVWWPTSNTKQGSRSPIRSETMLSLNHLRRPTRASRPARWDSMPCKSAPATTRRRVLKKWLGVTACMVQFSIKYSPLICIKFPLSSVVEFSSTWYKSGGRPSLPVFLSFSSLSFKFKGLLIIAGAPQTKFNYMRFARTGFRKYAVLRQNEILQRVVFWFLEELKLRTEDTSWHQAACRLPVGEGWGLPGRPCFSCLC